MSDSPRPDAGGLAGVVVGTTRLSHVDGERGQLTLAGYPMPTLALALSAESIAFLLARDRLPDDAEREALRARWAAARHLPATVVRLVTEIAEGGGTAMHALRLGVAALSANKPDGDAIIGALPTLLGVYVCARAGRATVPPHDADDQATAVLRQCFGTPPSPQAVRALATYLVAVADHGMNASTFTARVVASTGAELGACIEGALGALEGPLHGGAPGPALEALLRLRAEGDASTLEARTRTWVTAEVAAGRRIMGFGHRVYRVRDPRADVLATAAEQLLDGTTLLADARVHERAIVETLAQLKPQRPLATNVEYYTALLLHGLGFRPPTFTAVFAVGRAAGWVAHVTEQRATGTLIRPRVAYTGAHDRTLTGLPG